MFCHFPIGCPGYLIVSIPDLCLISYFENEMNVLVLRIFKSFSKLSKKQKKKALINQHRMYRLVCAFLFACNKARPSRGKVQLL